MIGSLLIIVMAACASEVRPPATATPAPPTLPVSCEEQLVPPQIMEIQPAQPAPGDAVTVIGSGGYLQDTCGGYNESSRGFPLYLDNEPIGDLVCYVNHCETKVTLPTSLEPGPHCFSVALDICEFEFEVAAP